MRGAAFGSCCGVPLCSLWGSHEGYFFYKLREREGLTKNLIANFKGFAKWVEDNNRLPVCHPRKHAGDRVAAEEDKFARAMNYWNRGDHLGSEFSAQFQELRRLYDPAAERARSKFAAFEEWVETHQRLPGRLSKKNADDPAAAGEDKLSKAMDRWGSDYLGSELFDQLQEFQEHLLPIC